MILARERLPGEVFRVLNDLVDVNYLQKMFRRSDLSILLWRRKDGLPFVIIPGGGRDTIRFSLPEVVAWAREKGKRVYAVSEVVEV